MFAHEFFSDVDKCRNSGCSTVVLNAAGAKISRLRYHDSVISTPEELLILKSVYQTHEYMYARFKNVGEIEIVDSNDREPWDLRIEMVSQCGTKIVIDADFVGTD